jgi:hypothetical protein
MTEGFLRLELGGLCDRTTVKQGANSMAIKKDTTSQGYDCSTVIGLGCIAGAIVLLVTEVPALALLTMGIVEVPVPERGDNPEKRAERGEKLFATAIEAIE